MNIALVQHNPIIAAVKDNTEILVNYIRSTFEQNKPDVIVLPELCITGYPPRDLLHRSDLIESNLTAKDQLVALTKEIPTTLVFGYVEKNENAKTSGGKPLFNAACVAQGGKVIQTRYKTLLPTYDVFEEERYFQSGLSENQLTTVEINGVQCGIIICEEAWNDKNFWKTRLYDHDPVQSMVSSGAKYIISINASPYRRGVKDTRHKMVAEICRKYKVGFAYCNQVGANDEVIFDGNSFAMNNEGEIIAHASSFVEDVLVFNTNQQPVPKITYDIDWQGETIKALTLGIKDYFGKIPINGPAIIGLSGGIDSALVAFLAACALGPKRVIGVGMPSEFSSDGSVTDAEKLARKLGINFIVQPIKSTHTEIRNAVDIMNSTLIHDGKPLNQPHTLFGKSFLQCKESGVTDENIQARIRGLYLMALSNYYNGIVLSTGNKSEMAVGYATLYGDMAGGLAVISDVIKTDVYAISKYINEITCSEVIPWGTIQKPPSAELRNNQVDQDSLPPYWLLDEVVKMYVEKEMSPKEILHQLDTEEQAIEYLRTNNRMIKDDILKVCNLIIRNEFKRKQAPTGLKITQKHFKYGWQQPIVHRLGI